VIDKRIFNDTHLTHVQFVSICWAMASKESPFVHIISTDAYMYA
jgi:hypothetical protein